MLEEFILKVVLIGQGGAGKTALLTQYMDGTFSEKHQSTIGVDFKLKKLSRNDCLATLQLWDTAGQDRFRAIVSSFYRGAMGIIFVFDLTDVESFNKIPLWEQEAGRFCDNECVKLLVGNKMDLDSQRAVTADQAKKLARSLNMEYIETSAKSAHNVHAAFDRMADRIIQYKKGLAYIGGAMTESFRLDSMDTHAAESSWCSGYCY